MPTSLLALCCFGWAAASGPVDGYFIHRGELVVAASIAPQACLEVAYGDLITVAAYDAQAREVGPSSPPWEGQDWGRCSPPGGA